MDVCGPENGQWKEQDSLSTGDSGTEKRKNKAIRTRFLKSESESESMFYYIQEICFAVIGA